MHSVYIMVGEEDLLKEKAIAAIKNRCFPSANNISVSLNCLHLNATDTTSKRITAECRQLPFMAQRRLVIIKDADNIIDDILAGYVKNPVKTTCLVLTARKINKQTSAYKILKKYADIQEFARLPQKGIPAWIQQYIRKNGKIISAKNAFYMSTLIENSLMGIRQELDKLLAYTGKRALVSRDDIDNIISQNRIRDNFALINAIQNRDTKEVLNTVDILLRQGCSVQNITGTLRWMLIRLWRGKDLLRENADRGTLTGELRIPPYYLGRFIQQAERFSIEELKKGVLAVLSSEKLLRTYNIPGRIVLEFLGLQLTEKTSV